MSGPPCGQGILPHLGVLNVSGACHFAMDVAFYVQGMVLAVGGTVYTRLHHDAGLLYVFGELCLLRAGLVGRRHDLCCWSMAHAMGRAVYVSGVGLHHDVLCISGACFFVVGGVLYASGVGSHLDVPCISGACLLLWAGFSVFQGLGHIMMYCIFPDHVSCCATS